MGDSICDQSGYGRNCKMWSRSVYILEVDVIGLAWVVVWESQYWLLKFLAWGSEIIELQFDELKFTELQFTDNSGRGDLI